uniref:Orf230 n=1 Tax=Flammulina velutipes TaxID=38945 RepID=M9MU61_FLAVE|nr:orf230 [Flammulina velutipes]AEF33907.1 orf230 [Flammulina velutipes]AEO19636.1 orf230 [Flammulina velutipes]AEO19668.1 orf230 [Flammulina velutipes]AEO19699.1 orf230 [Flammulina velutipes]
MIDFKIKEYIILFKNTELDIDSLIVNKNMLLGFLFENFESMEKLSKLLIIYCIFSFIILNCLFIIVINIYKDFFLIKFNIKEKFPKLIKFINKKTNNYYILVYFLIIIFICLGQIILGIINLYPEFLTENNSLILSEIYLKYENLNIISKVLFLYSFSAGLVLNCVWVIALNFYGEYLITKYKLDDKYPKLARFINMRKKIGKFYILSNITFITLISLSQILLGVSILSI